ncbi:hypothetical protein CN984_12395 [Bacillus cereus]|uniref:Uncharacterized protein n=1 Tax=Bacillus cereus TaxID=1396 RepID=A0A2B9Q423_BACCE|nr:hypothetical protein [Bacillus cereus]PEA25794.1 hypothetical protein CON44_17700 [Bacillus cereus]PGO29225.1 hypothetical protein CN984_12395 [Bacillus cereus]
MKQAIHELSHVVEGHFHIHDKQDITIVLNTRDMLELIKLTDVARYDYASIRHEGEYHIISSCVDGETRFFVEDVRLENGCLKYDETDLLFLPSYLPQEMKEYFVNQGEYDKLIEFDESSRFEDLITEFNN